MAELQKSRGRHGPRIAGTPDSATVDWGTASPSDQIVLHFVEDVAGSYISQKMPGNNIRGDVGFGAGDPNLYRYVLNIVNNLTDPLGLKWYVEPDTRAALGL